MAEETHYEVLGLSEDATQDEVHGAYRRLVKQVHPDRGGSDALFRQVQEAHDTLGDPVKRADYDRSRKRPSTDRPETEQTGWVRVDEPETRPPPGTRQRTEPPPRWPPPPPGTRQRTTPPPSWPPPWTPPRPPAPTIAERRWPGFLTQHPIIATAAAILVVLVVISMLASASGALALAIVFIVGLVFWSRRKDVGWGNRALQVDPRSLDAMTGPQFEQFLESLFGHLGYRVKRIGAPGDFGADLVLDGPDGRTVVQAKRWSTIVGHRAVQEIVAAKAPYRADRAMVVTTSMFSEHARKLAQANGVVLWERRDLARELSRVKGR